MDTWRILPPLAALRAFAAWSETGSMTAAGAVLNVSHAAVSQQIRALEDRLGLQLLDRRQNPPRATPEGERLGRALRDGFGAMAATIAEMTGAESGRPLQVTTSPSFAAAWLLPRLSGFRAAHPDISLMLDPTVELRTLAVGGIDLAIRFGTGPWPGLEARLLLPAPLVVVAAPALAQGIGTGDVAALARLPWIEEPGVDDRLALFSRAGVERAQGATMSLPGELIIAAACAGQGIAVTTEMFVAADIAAGRLRMLLRLDDGKGYWLVHRPGPLRPAARAFAHWVQREAQIAAPV